MKKNSIKKIILLVVTFSLIFNLVSCGTKYISYTDYTKKDLEKYVTLGKYKNVETEKPSIEVTEEEINLEIDKKIQSKVKETEITEGTVQKGDSVKITYVGKLNGEAFDGGSTGDGGTIIELGNSGYIEGFDDGVIGMKIGDTKVLNLQFPKDYWNKDLADKKVTFDVGLVAKIEREVPEFNEAFVKANSDKNTTDEYKQMIKEEIEKVKADEVDMFLKQDVWSKIIEASEIKEYPKDIIKRIKDDDRALYKNFAKEKNMTLEDVIYNYTGMDQKAYEEYLNSYSEAIAKQELIMFSIALNEDIKISEKEFDDKVGEIKEQQGIIDEEAFKKETGKTFIDTIGRENIIKAVLISKVMDLVMQNAKVEEAKVTEK